MPIFVQFTKLTEQGRTTKRTGNTSGEVNKGPNQILADLGVKILHQYALLGPYDFVNILEAESQDVITKLSVEINSLGMATTVTMPANSIPDLKRIVGE